MNKSPFNTAKRKFKDDCSASWSNKHRGNGIKFDEDLLSRIKNGENKQAKFLIEIRCLFYLEDDSGSTLLHYAAQYGNANLTRYLVNRVCDINAKDLKKRTALMLAVLENHETIIRILLAAGAEIKIFKKNELSLSHYSFFLSELQKVCSSNEDEANKLVEADCELYQAIFTNPRTIECMIESGCRVDFVHLPSKKTALHYAVMYEYVEIIEVLLKYGADANAIDDNGFTPLWYVHHSSNPQHTREKIEILQLLLANGSLPTSLTPDGIFQVYLTLISGNSEAIRVVLQSNLDFTVHDKCERDTVLHCIMLNTNPGMVEELKRYSDQLDVNVLNVYGKNPLFKATEIGNANMVEFLLEQGTKANLIKRGSYIYTPLFCAYFDTNLKFDDQYIRCVELLLQYNADPQFIANFGGRKTTIFDASCKANRLNRTKPLVAHLALSETLVRPISIDDTIRDKIDAHAELKRYFCDCQRVLRRKITGTVTLLKLLTVSDKKFAQYLGNEELVLKLRRISCKQTVRSSYSYYYNILKMRCSDGIKYRRILDKVAGCLCRIFENRIDKTHLVIINTISYLDDESMWVLCQI